MTNGMQGSPLVHSASSILRCSVYSAAKSFPTAAVQHRINVMSNADKLLLNRSAPASKGPPQDQLPLCLDRSTNGALRRGPQGPLTTKQAPRESSPPFSPSCHLQIPQSFLHPHGCIDLHLFNQDRLLVLLQNCVFALKCGVYVFQLLRGKVKHDCFRK